MNRQANKQKQMNVSGRRGIEVYSYKGKHCFTLSTVVGMLSVLLSIPLFFLPGVRFSGCFFLLVAGLCLLWKVLCHYERRFGYIKICKVIFLVCISAFFVGFVTLEALVLSHSGGDETETPVSAVIVLGAGVNGETPSLSLQTRINAAAEYLTAHPGIPAVLSGGQGNGEDITEAEAMRRGLVALGIDGKRLLLEKKSTNTAENFAFSSQVLEEHDIDPAAPLAVVSNDFHLFRAGLIADRAGMENTIGIPARLPWWWLSANYYLRESFATVKTLLFD